MLLLFLAGIVVVPSTSAAAVPPQFTQRADGLWSVRAGMITVDARSAVPSTPLVLPRLNMTIRGFSLLHYIGTLTWAPSSTAGNFGNAGSISFQFALNSQSNIVFPPQNLSWDPRVSASTGSYNMVGVNALTAKTVDFFTAPTPVRANESTTLLVWFYDTKFTDNVGTAQYWVDVLAQSDAGQPCASSAGCLSGSCLGGRCCGLLVNASVCGSCDVGGTCNGCADSTGRQLGHAAGCVTTATPLPRADGLYDLSMPGTYTVDSTTTAPSAPITVPVNMVLRGVGLTYLSGSLTTADGINPAGRFGDAVAGSMTVVSIGSSTNVFLPDTSAYGNARFNVTGCPSACYKVVDTNVATATYLELYSAPTLVTGGAQLALWYRDYSPANNFGAATYTVTLLFESFAGGPCNSSAQCPGPDACVNGVCGGAVCALAPCSSGSSGGAVASAWTGVAVPLGLTCLMRIGQACGADAECFSETCRGGRCCNPKTGNSGECAITTRTASRSSSSSVLAPTWTKHNDTSTPTAAAHEVPPRRHRSASNSASGTGEASRTHDAVVASPPPSPAPVLNATPAPNTTSTPPPPSLLPMPSRDPESVAIGSVVGSGHVATTLVATAYGSGAVAAALSPTSGNKPLSTSRLVQGAACATLGGGASNSDDAVPLPGDWSMFNVDVSIRTATLAVLALCLTMLTWNVASTLAGKFSS